MEIDSSSQNEQEQINKTTPEGATSPDSSQTNTAEIPTTDEPATGLVVVIHKKRLLSKKQFLVVATVAVLVAPGVGGYFLTRPKKTNHTSTNSSSSVAKELSKPVTTLEPVWNKAPEKLADLKLFTNLKHYYGDPSDFEKNITFYTINYYKIGTAGKKTLIMAVIPVNGPGQPQPARIIQNEDGTYVFPKTGNEDWYATKEQASGTLKEGDYTGPDFTSVLKLDETVSTNNPKAPDSLTYKNNKFKLQQYSNGFMIDGKNLVEQAKIDPGTFYFENGVVASDYSLTDYVLILPDFTYYIYDLDSGLPTYKQTTNGVNNDIYDITWKDGSKNTDDYYNTYGTCAIRGGNEVALGITDSDVVERGSFGNGTKVYTFRNSSYPLFKKHYDDYRTGHEGKTYTLTEFYNKNPIFIIKDGAGRFLVFTNVSDDVGMQAGGCAKPVVYLYPTKPTKVDVIVGADVRVSDPTYNNGWFGVLAQPNGDLTYNGKSYGSLFWEGFGTGSYPTVRTGTIVPQSLLQSTLISQLSQLGLNKRESADFMTYWLPRLPKTPYVRLSWLDTKDMQQIAPLNVSPKPDTLIRLFLDYEGLDKPAALQPQTLRAVPRHGFTVVEWGGTMNTAMPTKN